MQKSAVSSQEVSYPAPWVIKTNNESRTDLSVTPSFQKYCEEGKTAGSHLTLDCSRTGKIWLKQRKLSEFQSFPEAYMFRGPDAWFSPESRNTWPYRLLLATTPSNLPASLTTNTCSQGSLLLSASSPLSLLPSCSDFWSNKAHSWDYYQCLVITVRCIKSNLLIKCLCNKVYIDFRETIKSVIAYLKYK